MKKIIIAFILLTSISGMAQEKKWTLQACIDYAHRHNLQLKQSQLDIKQAQNNKQTALGNFLPDLNANTSASWNSGLTQNVTTGILENQTTFGGSGSINTGMALFNGFRNRYQYKKSLLDILSAQYRYADMQNNIDIQIAGAYMQILLNKENYESAKIQLENSLRQKERSLEMIHSGVLPSGDLADAEAQVTNDNLQVVQAENAYELSKLNLAQLLELNDFKNFEIDENTEGLQLNETFLQDNPGHLYELAQQNNHRLKQSETQEKIAGYQVKLAQSAQYPSLRAFANVNTRYSDREKFAFGGMATPADPFWNQIKDNYGISYGINLQIPVFNGFNVRNQIRNARISMEKMKINTETSRKNLKNDIYKMHQDMLSAYQSMKAAEANLKAQRKAYDYAMEKFKVGMMNIFDLNSIKTKYMRAESRYINAKYQYYMKAKVLEYTIKG
jgi:outer membrane protein